MTQARQWLAQQAKTCCFGQSDGLCAPKCMVTDNGLALEPGGMAKPLRPALAFQRIDK